MASGKKTYPRILESYPIEENETIRQYVERVWDVFKEYGVVATQKSVIDSIREYLPRDRQVKTKRAETLNAKGEIITQRYAYQKEADITDFNGFEVTKVVGNPFTGGQWVTRVPKTIDYLEEIKSIFSELKFDKQKPFKKQKSSRALKVTLSDVHVGMSVNNSLFEYKYGKEEYQNSMNTVFQSVMSEFMGNGRFDVIIIQDLGDGLDGYNGQTTRGGHSLEQNMSNNEAYRTFVTGKLTLIKSIVEADIANAIEVYDTVNCNHSGDFGYTASYATKLYTEAVYKNVKYTIFEKFIEHFFYGEHCFIQSHGKDKQYMKSGMPLKLDDKTQRFISQYIDKFRIQSKYIHFEKGDLHQIGYNKCKQFDYRNFMSFAPPSNWVQHNFGDGYSGYSIQIISPDKREIKHIDYFLDYEC